MSSSPYVVLENRSLDQWKVTDLKEQLKRRNLTTKGLKDDLVKRLDQAVRAEIRQDNHHNGVNQTTNIDDGNTESLEDNVTTEDKHVDVAQSINILFNKNDTEDVGSPDKLNLDPTSGDDSMEEDVLETKQIDSNFTSQHIGDINEKTQVPPPFKEGEPLDVMAEDTPAANNDQSAKDTSDSAAVSTKRKLNEQEAVTNSEVVKRQRRWNSQGLNIPEQQNTRPSVSTTPKGGFQASIKHSFSRSNSSVSQEEPKERVVPPSLKDPTNSLRIDRFLRPFTLKAVQELLEKTGTVVSFWMDHIKTHCYVTYLSVDEAVETRNAVYNLQWPANGGRLLVAEFVDQSEVKSRTDAPLPSPATPVATTPTFPKQPPAATHTFPKQPPAVTHTFPKQPPAVAQPPQQQLPPPPPLPLPPPPPLSYPPTPREAALPPPPPLPEKLEPPIVTLDDLFRKTRATPRIYYLPLSEEQVAAKLKGQGRNANRI